jgi:hypothetical protein
MNHTSDINEQLLLKKNITKYTAQSTVPSEIFFKRYVDKTDTDNDSEFNMNSYISQGKHKNLNKLVRAEEFHQMCEFQRSQRRKKISSDLLNTPKSHKWDSPLEAANAARQALANICKPRVALEDNHT